MNHLMTYSDDIHTLYFLTRFIEGLRGYIRAVVMVQRPLDLDTAVSLACLHEEVADGLYSEKRTSNQYPVSRIQSVALVPLPWPAPPSVVATTPSKYPSLLSPSSEDRRRNEAARAPNSASKIQALKNYRRSRGLCFKRGERWGHEHSCPPSVSLHILEEMMDVLGFDSQDDSPDQAAPSTEKLMALSYQAISGTDGPMAMQIQGLINGKEVLILIDSGSTSSFITERLVKELSGMQQMENLVNVKVAGGGMLNCTHHIPLCQWETQHHVFTTDLKVLQLGSYDMILGYDWLTYFSPMKVDWARKKVRIVDGNTVVYLQGIHADTTECPTISLQECSALIQQGEVTHVVPLTNVSAYADTDIPAEVQSLLHQFQGLFSEPTSLPPRRECDHKIVLIPGARPVNVRPYRHKPEFKDEIERQVQEMLDNGTIQYSS